MEKKEVFVTYTNTDCTEGRGADVPIAVCELEATAIRLGRKRYVQGSDGPIRKAELIELDGKWYYPSQAVYVVPPTKEDLASQKVMDDRRAVIDKARAAGLTDDDLRMLGGKMTKARSHLEMVDAVNDATTERERYRAEIELSGWRECADYLGDGWSGIYADLHTMAKHGEHRPMCCGVLLDWEPE